MSAYRPKQRSVSVAVYTTAGWLSGNISTPPLQGLIDFLNQSKGFVKMTGVTLPSGTAIPFFALQRRAAVVVVPLAEEDRPTRSVGATSPRHVSVLLESGVLTGVIDVVSNLRVSDYLMQHTEFIGLRDCQIHVPAAGPAPAGAISYAVVNAARIVGASDEEAGQPAQRA